MASFGLAVAAGAVTSSPDVVASPVPAVAAAATFGRLINSGASLPFSPVLVHSQQDRKSLSRTSQQRHRKNRGMGQRPLRPVCTEFSG